MQQELTPFDISQFFTREQVNHFLTQNENAYPPLHFKAFVTAPGQNRYYIAVYRNESATNAAVILHNMAHWLEFISVANYITLGSQVQASQQGNYTHMKPADLVATGMTYKSLVPTRVSNYLGDFATADSLAIKCDKWEGQELTDSFLDNDCTIEDGGTFNLVTFPIGTRRAPVYPMVSEERYYLLLPNGSAFMQHAGISRGYSMVYECQPFHDKK